MYRTQPQGPGYHDPLVNEQVPGNQREKCGLELSSLGVLVLDRIALGRSDLDAPKSERAGADPLAAGGVVRGDFLVLSGGLCVPTEGLLRVEEHLGTHYVLGRSSWERCETPAHAGERLAARIADLDPHDLASEAIALQDAYDDA